MKTIVAKCFALVVLGFALNSQASYIYSNTNSLSDLNQRLYASDNVWFGDEVILAGSDRYMVAFDFEYWATNTSGLTVDIQLLLNDGTAGQSNGYDRPGTLVYGLSGLALGNTDTYGRAGVYFTLADFSGNPIFINGSDLTLALNFHFNGGGGDAGVDLYNPPTIGAGYPDYWLMSGGNWVLSTNNVFPIVNFGMSIQAVPEPSTFSVLLMGGLMALGFGRFFRRK